MIVFFLLTIPLIIMTQQNSQQQKQTQPVKKLKNMDKKEILHTMLEELENERPVALWLKILLEQWSLWMETIDVLLQMMSKAIKTTKNTMHKKKLESAYSYLEELKQKEANEHEQEMNEADDLLDSIG